MSIDLNDGVHVSRLIKIYLFPVGSINLFTFKKYVTFIQKFNKIYINTLTRFPKDNNSSPFKNYNWKIGYIKYKFIDGSSTGKQFQDFQEHRKIHGVKFILFFLKKIGNRNNVS